MKNLITFHPRALPLLFTIILFASISTVFSQDDAQKPEKYKVGDLVEVDILYTSKDPEKSMFWRKGKIIKLNDPENPFGSYTVKIDSDGRELVYGFSWKQWMRPQKDQGGDKNKLQPADEANKVADINPGDGKEKEAVMPKEQPAGDACPPSDEAGGDGQNDVFKRLIRAKYEHQPKEERDFTTTVTFQTFKPGATHKWRTGGGGEGPDGPGGKAGMTVYPVKAVFTVCSDYPGFKPTGFRGEIQKHQDNTTFNCFKNEFGEWQCNLGEGRSGEIQFIKK